MLFQRQRLLLVCKKYCNWLYISLGTYFYDRSIKRFYYFYYYSILDI